MQSCHVVTSQETYEFAETFVNSVMDSSARIFKGISAVKSAMMNIFLLAQPQLQARMEEEKARSALVPTMTTPKGLGSRQLHESSKGTPRRPAVKTPHSISSQTNMLLALDGVSESVMEHICDQFLDAVEKLVVHSHKQFFASLFGAENDSLGSNASDLDLTQKPTVRLLIDIKFSIPHIHLEPSLRDVSTALLQVSSSILKVLQAVQWWAGPSAGKPLYDVYEMDLWTKSVQDSIVIAVQSE